MKRLHYLINSLLLACFLTGVWSSVSVGADSTTEYKLKAAYLYNFMKFVQWPDPAQNNTFQPFDLCIYGNDPFGDAIDHLEGKLVYDQPLKISYIDDISEIPETCRVLFLPLLNNGELRQILNEIERKPILTISDSPGFAREGVMINMVTVNNKVRFEINPRSAQEAGIVVSSNLIKLAVSVRGEVR